MTIALTWFCISTGQSSYNLIGLRIGGLIFYKFSIDYATFKRYLFSHSLKPFKQVESEKGVVT